MGKIAGTDYGAFNVIWATHALKTKEDHLLAVSHFVAQRSMMATIHIEKYPLSEWLCILKPPEIASFIEKHRKEISAPAYQNIKTATYALARLQNV